jgi:hypothetical protein
MKFGALLVVAETPPPHRKIGPPGGARPSAHLLAQVAPILKISIFPPLQIAVTLKVLALPRAGGKMPDHPAEIKKDQI